jgi:hypothetical protein
MSCPCDPAVLDVYCHASDGHATDLQVIGLILVCLLGAAFCFWKARNGGPK